MRIEDILQKAHEEALEEVKSLEHDQRHHDDDGNRSPRLTRTAMLSCQLWELARNLRMLFDS